jgi:hypothetical protein
VVKFLTTDSEVRVRFYTMSVFFLCPEETESWWCSHCPCFRMHWLDHIMESIKQLLLIYVMVGIVVSQVQWYIGTCFCSSLWDRELRRLKLYHIRTYCFSFSFTRITDSNLIWGTVLYICFSLCLSLRVLSKQSSCNGSGPLPNVTTKCLNRFLISGFDYELEQLSGRNP